MRMMTCVFIVLCCLFAKASSYNPYVLGNFIRCFGENDLVPIVFYVICTLMRWMSSGLLFRDYLEGRVL